MSAADYYSQGAQVMREDQQRTEAIDTLLLEKLERWEALEAKSGGQ